MEKTSQRLSSASILSFLPNRTSFSHLSHHPYSPGRDVMKQMQRRGFSGPMVSIVPMEARRQKQQGGERFEAPEEPMSPKVTCMGRVKLRKMAARCSGKQKPPADDRRRGNTERTSMVAPLLISRIFRRLRKARATPADGGGGSSDEFDEVKSGSSVAAAAPARAPLLGQMRRFASGRESLREFDWRKAGSGDGGEEDSEDEEAEEVLVPHSAPLMVGNGLAAVEPRKEVNLWKRRTHPPPTPLQLN